MDRRNSGISIANVQNLIVQNNEKLLHSQKINGKLINILISDDQRSNSFDSNKYPSGKKQDVYQMMN